MPTFRYSACDSLWYNMDAIATVRIDDASGMTCLGMGTGTKITIGRRHQPRAFDEIKDELLGLTLKPAARFT